VFTRKVRPPDWEEGCVLAEHAWASPEVIVNKLVVHGIEALCCDDIACMDEAVKVLGCGVYKLLLLLGEIISCEHTKERKIKKCSNSIAAA
jgi:hypothetical protein